MRHLFNAALIVIALAGSASAEWGLYVSRNGKPWQIEKTYAFKDTVENSCERSARELWMAQGQGKGNVTGVSCQEYAALNYSPTQQTREMAAAQAERVTQRNAAEQAQQARHEQRQDATAVAANKATIDGARIQAGATNNVARAIRDSAPFAGITFQNGATVINRGTSSYTIPSRVVR